MGIGALDTIQATLKNPFSTAVGKNGEKGADFPGGFNIIEFVDGLPQNGLAGAPDTQIRFTGNMMPMQPFPWGGTQQLNKEYYAGNPEANVQVLGPREGPLVIKGRFKDKRYKDPTYYGVSYQFTKAVEAMRQRGNLVRFGMHGTTADWLRYGFIERADFKMNKVSWIDYEIEFFVIGVNKPQNNYFAAQEKNSPTAVNQNLINAAASFAQNYSATPASMPRSLADIINGVTNTVAGAIKVVTGFVSTVLSTVQSVESSLNRALGLIKNAQTSLYEFQQQLGAIETGFSSLGGNGSPHQIASNTYQNLSYIVGAIEAAHEQLALLAQMKSQFEAIKLQVPKARYKVQAGSTLQNISIQYYGIADHWTDIYSHNGLQSTVLVPGTVLEIPNV